MKVSERFSDLRGTQAEALLDYQATRLPADEHLWVIGFDDVASAERARERIIQLSGPEAYLLLLDSAVVARRPDGSWTFNREEFSSLGFIAGCGTIGLLAGLVVAAPVVGAAIGTIFGTAASIIPSRIGIDPIFIEAVAKLTRPGAAALIVLEDGGDIPVALRAIRGLGGLVMKTNVSLAEAERVQAALATVPSQTRSGTTTD